MTISYLEWRRKSLSIVTALRWPPIYTVSPKNVSFNSPAVLRSPSIVIPSYGESRSLASELAAPPTHPENKQTHKRPSRYYLNGISYDMTTRKNPQPVITWYFS